MDISRYIVIQAIKTRNNELIPVWDSKVSYDNDDYYGKKLKLSGHYEDYSSTVECIYDLKTKTISAGIEVDIYPDETQLTYKVGKEVFYEVSHHKLSSAKIEKIVYEEYDMDIKKGRKIEDWYKKRMGIQVEPDTIYCVKTWKPFYMLDNGTKIEWDHQLYQKSIKQTK